MRFINPKTDYAFKKIFGSTESKDILISFLNALVYSGNSTITDLEIINPNLSLPILGLKDTFLDVKATLDNGTLVIIEIQVLNIQSFSKQVLFNAAETYAFQLQAREGYRMLKPLVALTLTDFNMFPNQEKPISRFVYKEETEGWVYPDHDMDLVFMELPKFTKTLEELETITDKWIYFMKYARALTKVPENMEKIPQLTKAFEIANQANLTATELEDLDRQEMFIYDQQRAINLGIQQGREEGREEEKRVIARNLLPQLDDAAIALVTGLSLQAITQLRQETQGTQGTIND